MRGFPSNTTLSRGRSVGVSVKDEDSVRWNAFSETEWTELEGTERVVFLTRRNTKSRGTTCGRPVTPIPFVMIIIS